MCGSVQSPLTETSFVILLESASGLPEAKGKCPTGPGPVSSPHRKHLPPFLVFAIASPVESLGPCRLSWASQLGFCRALLNLFAFPCSFPVLALPEEALSLSSAVRILLLRCPCPQPHVLQAGSKVSPLAAPYARLLDPRHGASGAKDPWALAASLASQLLTARGEGPHSQPLPRGSPWPLVFGLGFARSLASAQPRRPRSLSSPGCMQRPGPPGPPAGLQRPVRPCHCPGWLRGVTSSVFLFRAALLSACSGQLAQQTSAESPGLRALRASWSEKSCLFSCSRTCCRPVRVVLGAQP